MSPQPLIDFFARHQIPDWLTCFFISMLPVLELRGGLIAGSLMGIPWGRAAAACVAGNLLPVPVILLCARGVLNYLRGTRLFGRLATHFESRALRGAAQITKKYPRRVMLGLCAFVAIPLPMTGAWTGALIAAFLGLSMRRAMPAIVLGVAGAAGIMSLLAYGFPAMMGF